MVSNIYLAIQSGLGATDGLYPGGVFGFLFSLLIAAISGWIGASLAGRERRLGCVSAIVVGFIGSLLGSYIAEQLGLPLLWDPQGFPVIWAIAGAALFMAVLGLFIRPQPPENETKRPPPYR